MRDLARLRRQGNAFLGSSKRCLFVKAGVAVQNPGLPLTVNTEQYERLWHSLHQKRPALSSKTVVDRGVQATVSKNVRVIRKT